jgi:MYXO-CTERM domain-containing protein
MNTKKILGFGALALSLTATAGSAFAGTLDPTLGLVFSTDGSTQTTAVDSTGTVATRGLGVGYNSGSSFAGAFVISKTVATAQSVYNPLIAGTSAAGAFTTIATGSTFQLALHGYASNQADPTQPVTVFASLFNYDPTAGTNQVPVTGPAIFTVPVSIFDPSDTTDNTYFSDSIKLSNAIIAGNKYVLAVSPGAAGGSNPANFATADRANFNLSGITGSDAAFDKQYFLIDNNSDATGGTFASHQIGGLTQGLGYRFYAAAGNPVPEASSLISFGVLLGLGGLFLMRRRRTN